MLIFIYLNNNSGFQIRRLRIEIEKLQWLHQQELSEMKHNLGEISNMQSFLFNCFWSSVTSSFVPSSLTFFLCRAYNGRNEAKSGTGKREVSVWGKEADRSGEATSRGWDKKEAVVCQLQEGGHLLLLLEHQLLRLPLSASTLARTHEVVHSVR